MQQKERIIGTMRVDVANTVQPRRPRLRTLLRTFLASARFIFAFFALSNLLENLYFWDGESRTRQMLHAPAS